MILIPFVVVHVLASVLDSTMNQGPSCSNHDYPNRYLMTFSNANKSDLVCDKYLKMSLSVVGGSDFALWEVQ